MVFTAGKGTAGTGRRDFYEIKYGGRRETVSGCYYFFFFSLFASSAALWVLTAYDRMWCVCVCVWCCVD